MTDRENTRPHWKPGLVPGFFLAILVAACGQNADLPGARPATLSFIATIDADDLDEISGIARSQRSRNRLWLHVDSGGDADLFAIDLAGTVTAQLALSGADNVDWEDLASYEMNGNAMLIVADTGDNDARREYVSFYVIAEPELTEPFVVQAAPRRIDARFADGPHDAEAIAVDIENDSILLLSKRELPPRLYEIPLSAPPDSVVTIEPLMAVTTLPPPRRTDVELARQRNSWHWQPTAMDIAPDGSALAILTYSAVYYYARQPDETWQDALRKAPLRFRLGDIRDAEAIAFGADAATLYVTVEHRNAPLIRIQLEGTEHDAN